MLLTNQQTNKKVTFKIELANFIFGRVVVSVLYSPASLSLSCALLLARSQLLFVFFRRTSQTSIVMSFELVWTHCFFTRPRSGHAASITRGRRVKAPQEVSCRTIYPRCSCFTSRSRWFPCFAVKEFLGCFRELHAVPFAHLTSVFLQKNFSRYRTRAVLPEVTVLLLRFYCQACWSAKSWKIDLKLSTELPNCYVAKK